MSLDKKSLIQILLLVVLIVIGVGAYLMQQDGGLDSLTSFFKDDSATAEAPATRAPINRAPAASAPEQKAHAEKPAIPAGPAKGELNGKPFVVESSSIESGAFY